MTLNELIQQALTNPSKKPMRISADWGQGRAIFGGLLSSLVYCAMRKNVSNDRQILSLSTSFIAPLEVEQDFFIEVVTLRAGKSATQLEGKITQNGSVIVSVLGLFGTQRESTIQVNSIKAPNAPQPDSLPQLPFIPNVVPEFTKHFDYRWAFGNMPFSNTHERDMGGWVRLKDVIENQESHFTDAYLIAMIDAWPPAVLPMLKKPAPASTMSWTISFVQPMLISAQAGLLYKAEIDHAANGYAQIRSHIWNSAGELVAISSQTVAVFD